MELWVKNKMQEKEDMGPLRQNISYNLKSVNTAATVGSAVKTDRRRDRRFLDIEERQETVGLDKGKGRLKSSLYSLNAAVPLLGLYNSYFRAGRFVLMSN